MKSTSAKCGYLGLLQQHYADHQPADAVIRAVTWSAMILTPCGWSAVVIKMAKTTVEAASCSIEAKDEQNVESNKDADGGLSPCTPGIAGGSADRLLSHPGVLSVKTEWPQAALWSQFQYSC